MTHGPGSSEDNAIEGKLSRIAFSGTIARNHSVRFFAGATNRRDASKHSRAPRRLVAALAFAAALAIAPHPAFAQHGGGGGGGHAGGGGIRRKPRWRLRRRWRIRRRWRPRKWRLVAWRRARRQRRRFVVGSFFWHFRQHRQRRRNEFRRAFGPVLPLHRRQHVAGSSEHCNARRRPALLTFHHARRSRRIRRARRRKTR